MYYTYIVECADQTFYTGITTDLERRIQEHNENDRGAKYTRTRRPVKLVFSCQFKSRSAATKEELRIKSLSKKEKKALVRHIG